MRMRFGLTCLLLLVVVLLGGCLRPWWHSRRAVKQYAAALAFYDADFEEDALVQLRQAVRLDSDFTLAHSMLGDLYRRRGRFNRAAAAYENACRLDPYAFDDHLHLGQVYRLLERFGDAVGILRRACQLRPNSADANYNLGVCYYQTEKYDLAAAFCSRAAELAPNNREIRIGLGDIYGRTGAAYRSVQAYKQALEIDPNQYDVMIRLGMVYLHMERFEPARFILDKAVAAAPRETEPYIALAYCLLYLQELPAALQHYRCALRLDPDSYAAHNGVGVSYMMMYLDEPEKIQYALDALECWHRSLEINPDQPKIKSLLAKYRRRLPSRPTAPQPLTQPPSEPTPGTAYPQPVPPTSTPPFEAG